VLASQNVSNGTSHKFVQYVFGWDEPSTLSSWRGRQYFNSGTIGQKFRIDLIAVDLEDARRPRRVHLPHRDPLVTSSLRPRARPGWPANAAAVDDGAGELR
jgi:hypothetical protein